MIGRFAQPGNFRELLSLKEFYLTSAGALLIIASFILDRLYINHLLSIVLALAALAILGGPIIWGAMKGLWEKQLNVDELVSLAMVASVVIGEYLSASVVALIMVLGSLLEKFTSQRSRAAIQSLVSLNPVQATVLRDNIETSVPLSEIQPGELVIIRPGEQVPVDGVVVRGTASINQASLTGESLPIDKEAGDSVYAGSANYSGMLVVRVEKVGEDTTFGKLIRLVQEAEQTRAPILRVADRYARYFTPLIVGLSLAVYMVSGDTHRAITVLIVGCPCAFILAAPTAITAALGNAARNGVLIKGGAFLEELGRVNAVVFDKTGTLTTGRPVVTEIIPLNDGSQFHVLELAASAEKYSEHPLARAILEAAETNGCSLTEPEEFRQIPGKGIEALVEGKKVFVGVAPGVAEVKKDSNSVEASTNTCLLVSLNEQPAGYLMISDKLRPEARELIPELCQLGVQKVLLLTGDSHPVAAHIARASGINEFHASLLPEQKLQYMRTLQNQGFKVAMVGDGINDAPSLAASNIGIAMGAMGTAVAIESADIALMADDLTRIPYSIKLGKDTLKTINYNIIFAMIFNLLAIAASAMGYLNPIMGAFAHNVGSVLVVLNSARLIRKRIGLRSNDSFAKSLYNALPHTN
ncbi:putative cadmium-transporting ATPase [Pelotomaculum sp. FP]|uniref:heavy metal translocating P-type ATPase n=1 Tax=Pelotomaculum sp. FP TaxID=261474 RepID=UPI001066D562|nr:cation-translocating P-type ATPase [Pelotomaculum sp. FP]TEB14406.1 putative cadmium-transporting ATPase [Pelotomaculum sp. FP]